MKRVWGLGIVVLSLVGCASAPRREGPSEEELEARAAAQYVDHKMAETLTSIDRSLQTLIILERGAEAPRAKGPIGETVAGAAGSRPPTPKPAPENIGRPATPPATGSGASGHPIDASALDVRLEISWTGSWEGLLQETAKALGFRYVEKNKGTLGNGTWSTPGATARTVLEAVASKVKNRAEIRVILREKTIEVVYL